MNSYLPARLLPTGLLWDSKRPVFLTLKMLSVLPV